MLIAGHIGLWGMLLVDPRAHKVDVSGGVTVEIRGGRAPRVPSPLETPVPSMLMIVSPNVDFGAVSRRSGSLMVGYAPRVQWRYPNRLSINRPILLHEAYLSYAVGFTRRWSLAFDGSTSVGELDYTGLQILLGPGQAETPEDAPDVAQIAVAHIQMDVTAVPDRRSRVVFGPRFDLRMPIGRSVGISTLPQQISGGFLATTSIVVDALDEVDATVFPGIYHYNEGVTFLNVDARAGWGRALSRLWASHLELGVFAAHRIGEPTLVPGESNLRPATRVFPVGSLDFTGRLWSKAGRKYLDGTLSAGVLGFFDRITEQVEPRALLALGIDGSLPPKWAIGVRGSIYTAVTPQPRLPRVIEGQFLELPETVIQAQTPITYTIDHQTRFEFGTVMSVRGTHFRSDNFRFSQLETWVYVAIRFAASTSRGRMELGPRSSGAIGAGTAGMGAAYGGL